MLKMKHEHFPDGLFLHLSTPKFTLLYSYHLQPTIKLQTSLTHLKQYQIGYQCYHRVCTCKCAQVFKNTQAISKMCQKADMKQASCHPYGVPTNIRYHRRKFSFPHKLVHWICTPSVHTSSFKQYVSISIFKQNMNTH
jgi:hypothetical protein